MKHPRPPAARRRPARGFSMIECLVSMSMLGFGLLELVSFEGRLIGQGTEAQHRMTATLLADELLNTMLVDVDHAGCYTVPQAGDCSSEEARVRAADWQQRALAALPGDAKATSRIDAASDRMTVTLSWQFKPGAETRQHEVSSDIRGN
jgi:prepilin-type N-terminal cleavage/methylation domain-containing protein